MKYILSVDEFFPLFLPKTAGEEDDDREDFETSDEHEC